MMDGFLSGVWFGVLICLCIECMIVGMWWMINDRWK